MWLGMVVVQVLKHEWPARWPRFIPDLVSAAKSSETLCENCMVILKVGAEAGFEIIVGDLGVGETIVLVRSDVGAVWISRSV